MSDAAEGAYKGAYYQKTVEYFAGRFVQPALVSQPVSKPGLDICAFVCDDGTWVTTSVGNPVGPGADQLSDERFEICALTASPIDDVVAMVATLAMDFRDKRPALSPFDKLHYADASQVPHGRFFLLDAGGVDGPFRVHRLLAVPVTDAEYDSFVAREEAPRGEMPQVLRILKLPHQEDGIRRLPLELLKRWG